jgi:hypothetical protein
MLETKFSSMDVNKFFYSDWGDIISLVVYYRFLWTHPNAFTDFYRFLWTLPHAFTDFYRFLWTLPHTFTDFYRFLWALPHAFTAFLLRPLSDSFYVDVAQ